MTLELHSDSAYARAEKTNGRVLVAARHIVAIEETLDGAALIITHGVNIRVCEQYELVTKLWLEQLK